MFEVSAPTLQTTTSTRPDPRPQAAETTSPAAARYLPPWDAANSSCAHLRSHLYEHGPFPQSPSPVMPSRTPGSRGISHFSSFFGCASATASAQACITLRQLRHLRQTPDLLVNSKAHGSKQMQRQRSACLPASHHSLHLSRVHLPLTAHLVGAYGDRE